MAYRVRDIERGLRIPFDTSKFSLSDIWISNSKCYFNSLIIDEQKQRLSHIAKLKAKVNTRKVVELFNSEYSQPYKIKPLFNVFDSTLLTEVDRITLDILQIPY